MKKELTIEDIAPKIDFFIGTYSCEDMQHIQRGIKEGWLVIDWDVWLPTRQKNLQRDFVWTPLQKSEFIKSILRTYRFGEKPSSFTKLSIVTTHGKGRNKEDPTVWQIIDGKQRLSTVLDFMDNKIPMTHKGVEYYFNDLHKDLQRTINGFWFNGAFATLASEVSDDDKVDWFEVINFTATPQEQEHLNSLKNPINTCE